MLPFYYRFKLLDVFIFIPSLYCKGNFSNTHILVFLFYIFHLHLIQTPYPFVYRNILAWFLVFLNIYLDNMYLDHISLLLPLNLLLIENLVL